MKAIKTNVVLAGLMAIAFTLHADQTTPPADPAFTNPDAVSEQTYQVLDTQEETTLAQADIQAEPTPSDEASATESTDTNEAAMEEETPVALETEESTPAVEPMAETAPMTGSAMESTEETSTNEAEALDSGSVIIPLIVMDEVPLMDAIRNLARQAEINYMVDPRVPYGQMGPDGKVTPQPVLSIRWESVSAQQALVAVLNNYNLQMSLDPKTKIQRVTVRDPAAPDPLVTKIIQLKYSSPSNVVTAVKTAFVDKRSKVVADVRTSQIVVVTTEKEMLSIEEMVEQLDTPTRQVLIEARILETTASPKTVKGIDWSGTLGGQKLTFGNNALPSISGTPPTPATVIPSSTPGGLDTLVPADPGTPASIGGILSDPRVLLDTAKGFNPSTFFLNADGLSATLSFLNTHADTKQIATPRTVTLDNESARIEVTRAWPIFKNTAGTQGSPGGSEVTYTNLGVTLDVTPRISANDTVNLKVVPEVSDIFQTITKTVASTENQADVYDIRRMETRVLIPSGNTLVMGGLLKDRTRRQNTKVPILGDIPILGLAFRQDSKERDKINLMVFITPTIVQDSDFQPTPTDFLKNKFEEPEDKEWSAWDSGKPKDWSSRR